MWRSRPQNPPPAAPVRMLRAVTLIAVVAVLGLAAGIWQLQKADWAGGPSQPPPAPQTPIPVASPKPPEKDELGGDEIFMDDGSRHQMAFSVVTIVAAGTQGGPGALTELVLIRADQGNLFWTSDDPDKVPKLRSDYLAHVRDYEKVGTWWKNDEEAASYTDALVKASRTSPKAFAKGARRDLSFVALFEEPAKFRGEVIHIEGRLRLVTRYDPPLMAVQAGVKDLYEVWVFDERIANPYCILVSELPAGVAVGQVDHRISFDGYFFKRYRYKAVDSVQANQFRDAPLLIGRTLALRAAPPAAPATDSEWSHWLLPGFMGLLAASAFLTVFLLWWFRREDRVVRERVMALYGDFVEPAPDPAPPVATPVPPRDAGKSVSSGEPRKKTYTHGHDKTRAVHRALGQGGIDSS